MRGGLIATAHATASSYVASWYYFDFRGDTRAIADGDGQVTWSANYSEYGEIETSSGGSPQYGFVGAYGRISNPATGLIHMGARMYSANIGRFLSRDPIVGGSANDYEYTGGDPINRLDVSGRQPGCYCDLNGNTVCPPPTIGPTRIDTISAAPPGKRKVVHGPGGQVFVVNTRTGAMELVEPGSRYLPRSLKIDNYWTDMGSDLRFENTKGRGSYGRNLGATAYSALDNFPFKWASVVQITILVGTGAGNAVGQASVW